MTDQATDAGRAIPEDDLVLTVTCRDPRVTRQETPQLRWFAAHLTAETVSEDGADDDLVITDLADAEVVLVGLGAGLGEAFLQADGIDYDLAGPLEALLELDRTSGLEKTFPGARVVLIVDQVSVPGPLRGHGYAAAMIRELATHFGFLAGRGLVLAWPSPAGVEHLDPFTARAATRRLEAILGTVRMQPVGDSPIWCATFQEINES